MTNVAGKSGLALPVLGALYIAELTAAFETSMVLAALSKLIQAFGDPSAVGWLMSGYLLVGAVASAVAGRLGDMYGRRRIMLWVLALGTIGSVISATGLNFGTVLFGRCLQGVTAAVLPLAFGLMREHARADRVPLSIGIMISSASAGTAAGLVLGGMIVDNFDWNWIFTTSAVLSVLSMAAVLLLVPHSTASEQIQRLDYWGMVLFLFSIGTLLLAVNLTRSWGWSDPRTLSLTAVGSILLFVWIRQALRAEAPFIDVRLLSFRNIMIVNLIAVLVALSGQQITLVMAMLLQAPTWTGIGLGTSATVAGLVKLPSNILALAAGPISGWLLGRHGGRFTLMTGGIIMTLGWVQLIFVHETLTQITVILCVIAFGITMAYASVPNVIVASVPKDRISEATGMMSVIRTTSSAIGAQMITVLLATSTIANPAGGGGQFPAPEAFMLTLWVIAGLSLAATLVALFLTKDAARADTIKPL